MLNPEPEVVAVHLMIELPPNDTVFPLGTELRCGRAQIVDGVCVMVVKSRFCGKNGKISRKNWDFSELGI